MAEESGRSRFLSRSKWGKVFKENDNPSAQGSPNAFKLNDDVADFLKPSIEASKEKQASIRAHLTPKLNTALAKGGPDANTVRLAAETDAMRAEDVPMYYTKPRRRQGLMVGFVKTVPEIMGEGGDEAPDPPSEISRQKTRIARSNSDRRPSGPADGMLWSRTESRPALPQQQPGPVASEAGAAHFTATPLRRVQTSHDEFSPTLGRKFAAPSVQSASPPRTTLSRTPTGFNLQQHELDPPDSMEHAPPAPMSHSDRPTPARNGPDVRYDSAVSRPRLDMNTESDFLRTSSREPISPVVLKHRNMSAGEGAILRRASALFMENDENNGTPRDPNSGIQPSADYYDKLLNMTSGSLPPESTAARKDTIADSQDSSPFGDPRYDKRHSGDTPTKHLPLRTRDDYDSTASTSQLNQRPRVDFPPQQHSYPTLTLNQDSRPTHANHFQAGQSASQRPLGQSQPAQPNARVAPVSQRYEQRLPQNDEHQSDGSFPAQERQRRPVDQVRHPDVLGPPNQPPPTDFSIPSPDYGRGGSKSPATREQRDASGLKIGHANQLGEPISGVHTNHSPYSPPHDRLIGLRKPLVQLNGNGPARVQESPQSTSRDVIPPQPANVTTSATSGYHARRPAIEMRQDRTIHPSPDVSKYSAYKPPVSPTPLIQDDGKAQSALLDFGGRVAHMKGVFRLTAEKERAGEQCDSQAWLRAAIWWYLVGKAGLETMFHQRGKSAPELLSQPHVDLAKAWWIISDMLEKFDHDKNVDLQTGHAESSPESEIQDGVSLLRTQLQSLASSMTKSSLLPPPQSLIQGQDTKIWIRYPKFMPNDILALNGHTRIPAVSAPPMVSLQPVVALPLGDSSTEFCYGRFTVDAFLSTDDAESDRIMFQCMFSMIRHKRAFQTGVVIASQNELVNLRILPPSPDVNGLTWREVSWKASNSTLHIRLPRGLDLTIRMREPDFRAIWTLVEHSRKVEHSLRTEPDERLTHEVRLAELQYADSSNASILPHEKMRHCLARLFERRVEHQDGAGVRKAHRGFRLLLVTEPGHKSLSTTSHELCTTTPLYFEFLTDAAANGTTAMVIRVNEAKRQSRILLVFHDLASRQAFYDVVVGLNVEPDETIVTKATLTGFRIDSAVQATSFTASAHPALQALQWQRLGVTNTMVDNSGAARPQTIESESLRIIARHASGCITDRLNLSKGDMLLRLPCADIAAIEILRKPQEDLIISIDTRSAQPQVSDGITELYHTACEQLTIRTFTFASTADLHAFQRAITGWSVLYDGMASTFGISRRRMVVPIYHKWTANDVRLQIIGQDTLMKVVAFMEEFSHADAMVVQVKATDRYEAIKGDNKGKMWAIKMVDAKFSLPLKEEKKDKESLPAGGDEQAVRRRFVNLEGLDYASEHDDITIGFETEEVNTDSRPARDQFADALPKAGRLMPSTRRIHV